MKKIYLSLALMAAFAGATAQQKPASAQALNYKADLKASGITLEKTTRIDSLLQSFVDQKKASSLVGFATKDGNVVYNKAFGFKDVENQIPASVDDYYILFSQTKAVTTVAFMTLVEKGLVSVDDPVSKYFPEISNQVATALNEDGTLETRPAKTPMTFAHLMSHSSGLGAGLVGKARRAEMEKKNAAGGAPVGPGQRTGGAGTARYLKDDMIALAKYPLGFDPGSEWNYHISTNMLGYMVEVISGKSLREYVKSTVLIPLGMSDTDWYYEPSAMNRFVKAYNGVDGDLIPQSNKFSEATISTVQTYAEGAIGLNGPIGDYAKFCQMLLNKGEYNGKRILKAETIEKMTRVNRLPAVNSGGKGFQFGLGFELYNADKKPVPEVSNTAFAWGGLYGTDYIVDPENNMIVLFYLNMPKHEPMYKPFLSKAYQLFK
ncbi:serine hydrolase [Dyadobacter sp. CY312]|uniref:serine hydrolase domain-containing protein n=1 Tax=Dyadobacter sp. CY312 TaxID=2907303 RepID=UPI001F2B43A6|nr:serine hydrolase domain-containing protein [Dyadobacter sp. CY312]MCE7044095.1 beta-lactamase family protein [Dyadobacter sp. CY312]